MPGAAIVEAIGTLGSAAIGSRQASKATKAQERAADQALAYERERETARRNAAEQANAAYRKQWEAWNAQRLGLMKRYGMNVPAAGPAAPQARMSLADITRRPTAPPMAGPMQSSKPPALTLADLPNWSRRY